MPIKRFIKKVKGSIKAKKITELIQLISD